jgi:hypothetical protein
LQTISPVLSRISSLPPNPNLFWMCWNAGRLLQLPWLPRVETEHLGSRIRGDEQHGPPGAAHGALFNQSNEFNARFAVAAATRYGVRHHQHRPLDGCARAPGGLEPGSRGGGSTGAAEADGCASGE